MQQKEAVEWYQKAANQGHAGAQYQLGSCYCIGRGVEMNKLLAKKWWEKAAEQGNQAAIEDLNRWGLM